MVSLGNKVLNNRSMFQDEQGKPVPIVSLNLIYIEILKEFRNRNNKLRGTDIVIEKECSICRSLIWVSATQESNEKGYRSWKLPLLIYVVILIEQE